MAKDARRDALAPESFIHPPYLPTSSSLPPSFTHFASLCPLRWPPCLTARRLNHLGWALEGGSECHSLPNHSSTCHAMLRLLRCSTLSPPRHCSASSCLLLCHLYSHAVPHFVVFVASLSAVMGKGHEPGRTRSRIIHAPAAPPSLLFANQDCHLLIGLLLCLSDASAIRNGQRTRAGSHPLPNHSYTCRASLSPLRYSGSSPLCWPPSPPVSRLHLLRWALEGGTHSLLNHSSTCHAPLRHLSYPTSHLVFVSYPLWPDHCLSDDASTIQDGQRVKGRMPWKFDSLPVRPRDAAPATFFPSLSICTVIFFWQALSLCLVLDCKRYTVIDVLSMSCGMAVGRVDRLEPKAKVRIQVVPNYSVTL